MGVTKTTQSLTLSHTHALSAVRVGYSDRHSTCSTHAVPFGRTFSHFYCFPVCCLCSFAPFIAQFCVLGILKSTVCTHSHAPPPTQHPTNQPPTNERCLQASKKSRNPKSQIPNPEFRIPEVLESTNELLLAESQSLNFGILSVGVCGRVNEWSWHRVVIAMFTDCGWVCGCAGGWAERELTFQPNSSCTRPPLTVTHSHSRSLSHPLTAAPRQLTD